MAAGTGRDGALEEAPISECHEKARGPRGVNLQTIRGSCAGQP